MYDGKRFAALTLLVFLLTARAAAQSADKPVRTDLYGDPLPRGAIARLGTTRLRNDNGSTFAVFSPDGKILASGGYDDWLRLWDVDTGRERAHIAAHFAAFTFSSDGRTFLTAMPDGALVRWDSHGTKLRTWKVHAKGFRAAEFSPDGKVLAAATPSKDVLLWNVDTGRVIHRLTRHTGESVTLVFDRAGKRLAIGGDPANESIEVWDVASGRMIRRIHQPGRKLAAEAFSPDGKVLVVRDEDNKEIYLWDLSENKQTQTFQRDKRTLERSAFTSDGRILVTAATDSMLDSLGSICLWQVSSGKIIRQFTVGYRVQALAISPDDKWLAVSGWECAIQLFDLASGKELYPERGHLAPVRLVAFTPDGRDVITASEDTTVRFWEAATGRLLHGSVRLNDRIEQIASSPDGRTVAVRLFRSEHMLRLWNRANGVEIRRFGYLDIGTTVAFSPDGKTFVSGSSWGPLHFWDVASGKRVRSLGEGSREDQVDPIAYSPDARWVAVFSEGGIGRGRVDLWYLTTNRGRLSLHGRNGQLFSPVVSADGKMLAALQSPSEGERDLRIRVWEIETRQERRLSLTNPGHVSTFALAPDSELLATVEEEGHRVHVWDIFSGEELRHFDGHRGEITCLAFSPDGRTLASGSTDTTALIWDVSDLVYGRARRLVDLSPQRLEGLWFDLADDAARAGRSLAILLAGRQTTAFLKGRLRPIPAPDPRLLARLIADLDSAVFSKRERATEELTKLGEPAVPALRKALAERPSLEVRRRIEQILERELAVDMRSLRAIEVLEHIGSREARQVLQTLAEGAAGTRLTEEAKASLKRLETRPF